MTPQAVLRLVAKERGGFSCGRQYFLGMQRHVVFGIYADRTSTPTDTNLIPFAAPSFYLHHTEPTWITTGRGFWLPNPADVPAKLREMLDSLHDHLMQIRVGDYVEKQRNTFLEGRYFYFSSLFQASVLSFFGNCGDPMDLLIKAKAAAIHRRGDGSMRKYPAEVERWIELADQAIAALRLGSEVFRSFITDQEAQCLPRFCPKRPKALLHFLTTTSFPHSVVV